MKSPSERVLLSVSVRYVYLTDPDGRPNFLQVSGLDSAKVVGVGIGAVAGVCVAGPIGLVVGGCIGAALGSSAAKSKQITEIEIFPYGIQTVRLPFEGDRAIACLLSEKKNNININLLVWNSSGHS